MASLPAVVPGRYWIATIQDVAGKAVDWLIDNVVYAQDGMLDAPHAPSAPPDALDRLNALAVSAPPGSNGVIFAPWLNGERTPVDDPDVRGGWFNVSLRTTRADLARAVFEGIALNTRWMKEAVEHFVRRELDGGFDELTFIGGGANSALWCQTLADILGCTIRQAEQPVLANARGAGLYAADQRSARCRGTRYPHLPSRRNVHPRLHQCRCLRPGLRDLPVAVPHDHRLYARHNR